MNNNCPNCGERMSYNSLDDTWVCNNILCNYVMNGDGNNNISSNANKFEFTSELDIKNIEVNNNDDLLDSVTSDVDNNNISSIDTTMIYHCNHCNISFIGSSINNCFICNGNLDTTSSSINYSKYLDFNIDLDDAIHNYKNIILFRFLIPFSFRRKKTINNIKGIYIPMYVFDSKVTGDVIFESLDYDLLDSSKKNKNIHKYNVTCNGSFDYNDVLVNGSNYFKNNVFEKIDNYNYDNLKDFNEFIIGNNIIYKEDCDEYNIFDRLKHRCVNSSVKLMKDTITHNKSCVKDNKLDFNYSSKGIILVPVYALVNKYKNKNYYFLMNGQNGNTYYNFPLSIGSIIIFSLLLFTISFIIILLFAIFVF